MNIVHLTPGAGRMYCGGCFRDNALVEALRKLGHETLLIPLYLPLNLEEPDQSQQTPIFFGGLNVYLEQRFPLFRRIPRWLNRLLCSPRLLSRLGRAAAKTRPEDVGELTLSMLRGEEGNQARELTELVAWLKTQNRPDVICLSNSLLVGLARRLKQTLQVPILCTFQGEDGFLDQLVEPARKRSWQALRERAADIDLFIAPSQASATTMQERLGLSEERVQVIYNGIKLAGFRPAAQMPAVPMLGFFARMCREKGLDIVVEAFLILRQRGRIPDLRLRVGGSLGSADQPFVQTLQDRLRRNGAWHLTEFCPNVDRLGKLEFLRSLSLFSVPARYPEAFGLYVLEALASGVPVVLPRHGAFPELVNTTRGGVLFEPNKPNALADAVESLLLNPERIQTLRSNGLRAVQESYSAERMARDVVAAYEALLKDRRFPVTASAAGLPR